MAEPDLSKLAEPFGPDDMAEPDLSKLAEPFGPDDIEWRVSRAGFANGKVYCYCIAYITGTAVQTRLDQVCGPENWKNEGPVLLEFSPGKYVFAVGISIRIDGEWITKWDVAEPTPERGHMIGTAGKGGFTGATKRAGRQWGIGRILTHLDEMRAEVSETGGKGWNYARLPKDQGGGVYYWKAPKLPGWAMPKDAAQGITPAELNELKRAWMQKYMPDCKDPAELRDGFARFVASIAGHFPVSDETCWTRDALERCGKRIQETADPNGISPDVPI